MALRVYSATHSVISQIVMIPQNKDKRKMRKIEKIMDYKSRHINDIAYPIMHFPILRKLKSAFPVYLMWVGLH